MGAGKNVRYFLNKKSSKKMQQSEILFRKEHLSEIGEVQKEYILILEKRTQDKDLVSIYTDNKRLFANYYMIGNHSQTQYTEMIERAEIERRMHL